MNVCVFTAQGPGTVKLRRTVTRDLPIEAIPDEFCGRQFAVVVVDSDDDVIESSEDNAVSRPVSVLCENGGWIKTICSCK